ncbi:MAG: pentapeptide repeat-containing protein [Hymenobacteraceae bacterium]|nr:pentapeptide repeat-containing protein [Hymenobacteraceae bacterium]
MEQYIEGQLFKSVDFSEKPLPKGEYENCIFDSCFFLNANLAEILFVDCEFRNCDLSMANISGTAFRDTQFATCKLVGLHFENCNKFLLSMNFEACQLNLSSFYQLSLKKSKFIDCSLQEVDFTETDLTSARLHNCDLTGATFDRTVLEKADLRQSYNLSLDPESNRIRKAKFSMPAVLGLLDKYQLEIE